MTKVVRLHIIHRTPHRPNLSTIVNLAARRDESRSHGYESLTETAFVWFNKNENKAGVVIVTTTWITISSDGEGGIADGPGVAPTKNPSKPSKPGDASNKPTKKEEQDIISLKQFEQAISDEASAIAFMEEKIWGGAPFCPHCGSENCYRPKSGKPQSHRCRSCKKYFSVKVGTPMEKSLLPIRTWLLAIHFMHTARKGVSALQMHKMLGVSYPTAWFLFHRIREGMKAGDIMMTGIVEVDEAYIGGKFKFMHASKKPEGPYDNKVPVMGFRDSNGKVIIFPVDHVDTKTLELAVLKNVEPDSTIYSDSHAGYAHLSDFGYDHHWVNHTVGEFVRGMVTTNGIESFWALLKRGYVGTFHYMSPKHLHRYCNEFSFRHNSGPGNGFETIGTTIHRMPGNRLTWNDLTSGPPA